MQSNCFEGFNRDRANSINATDASVVIVVIEHSLLLTSKFRSGALKNQKVEMRFKRVGVRL